MLDQEKNALIPASCLAQARASQEWFATRVLTLSVCQLRWRPHSGSWSIAECLDHLNRTLDYYLPKIEQTVSQNPVKGRDATDGLMCREDEREFLRQLEPPIRIRLSSPSLLQPISRVEPGRIVDQFPHLRERYARAVGSASNFDLANISIAGSIHSPVESLGGVIALLAAHDRRHLWQAERIREAPGFPATPDCTAP